MGDKWKASVKGGWTPTPNVDTNSKNGDTKCNKDDHYQKPVHDLCSQESWRQKEDTRRRKGKTKSPRRGQTNGNKVKDNAAMLGDK